MQMQMQRLTDFPPRRAVRDLLLCPVRQRPKPAVRALRMEHRECLLDVTFVFDANMLPQRENSMLTFESSAVLGAEAIVQKLVVSGERPPPSPDKLQSLLM